MKLTKKTMYYIIGATLLLLAIYVFYIKPKKKANPKLNFLGLEPKTDDGTSDKIIATQNGRISADSNLGFSDPTIGTMAGVTRMASITNTSNLRKDDERGIRGVSLS